MKALALIAITTAFVGGPPRNPPPRVAGASAAPPPAWIDASGKATWLAYGSYCWTANGQAACVDMVPPAARGDVPLIKARRGDLVRVHLRFRPSAVVLEIGTARLRPQLGSTIRWRAKQSGLVQLAVKAGGQSAGYLARLRVY